MNEKEFEQLWEKAATQRSVETLAAGFPAWQVRRRRRRNSIMGFVAVCLIGGSVWFGLNPSEKNYDSVACNRSGYVDEHWMQIANEMLITQV